MWRRWAAVALFTGALSGCAGHGVYLTGRTTGLKAQNKFRILNPGSDVSFVLGNEIYTGRWVYMSSGGAVGVGTTTTFGGVRPVSTTGTFIGLPTEGNGTYIGTSTSGATLRCTFSFSQMNLKGIGLCQDSKGETFDMQIDD